VTPPPTTPPAPARSSTAPPPTSGPPPAADLHVDVTDEQVQSFRADGYLALERITTDEEVAWLRDVFEEIFANCTGGLPGGYYDIARPTDSDDPCLPQSLFPEATHPALADTLYVRNARRVASRLLGVPETTLSHWGHMLSKPPGQPNETPWHQDEAYWEPDQSYRAVGAWMPLDDADIDNGCLWFLPGSHLGEVRRHRHLGGDPDVNLLELAEGEELDTSTAVPVPLRAGGVSFHHPRMFHHARPNTTDRLRRAFANECPTVPQRLDPPADRPWVLESRRAFERRILTRLGP
jgi:hypothetical protein